MRIALVGTSNSVLKDGISTALPVGEAGEAPMKGVLGNPAQPEPKNILEISRLLIQKSESISVSEVPAPSLHRNLFDGSDEERREALFQKHYTATVPVVPA